MREPYGVDAFELRPGAWGQLCYNGRFSGWHGWWYEKTVVNIAFLARRLRRHPAADETLGERRRWLGRQSARPP